MAMVCIFKLTIQVICLKWTVFANMWFHWAEIIQKMKFYCMGISYVGMFDGYLSLFLSQIIFLSRFAIEKPLMPMVSRKTIHSMAMVRLWENHWKPIDSNGTLTKTIEHSIVLKNWPSLWSKVKLSFLMQRTAVLNYI